MDSIPSLRRKLAEANARIQELESRPPVVVEREVKVKGDVVRVEIPGPTRYVEVEVPGPERVVEVVREVETLVPVPMYPESVRRIETERVVYYENPDHVETIRKLQEQLWQFTSVSDSLSSQGQDEQSSLSAPLQAQE